MKYFTTAQWAQTWSVSMGDLDECLMELGYQTLNTGDQLRWKLTLKGQVHAKKSWNPFNHILRWDFEAFFDAMKHYGRKSRKYFYCPECGDYLNNQHGFDANMDKWVCKECGHVNDLAYETRCANELAQKYKRVFGSSELESQQPKVADVHWKCHKCGREACNIDEINEIFGFVKKLDGKLKPQVCCKECCGKEVGGE